MFAAEMGGARDLAILTLLLLSSLLLAPSAAHAAEDFTYGLRYIGELFADTSGGMQRGAVYTGQLMLDLDADLDRFPSPPGTTFHLSAYQIHGGQLSSDYVGNLETVSNIEADPSTRLYEAWLQRDFLQGRLALRAGQLGADTQFFISEYAGQFINGAFGWPTIMGAVLPSGAPAYPLATPGISARFDAGPQTTLLLGLYNGDPAGPGSGDPQRRDPNGLNLRVSDPPLVMTEAQFRHGSQQPGGSLPGTLKLGAFLHFGHFADQRYASDGLPLADPASNGQPLEHQHDYGMYGVLDQQLYRSAQRSVDAFLRVAGAPSDRNLVDRYFDAGLTFTGFVAARPQDAFGVAIAYAHISGSASGYDQDERFYSGIAIPIRDFESAIELNYRAQMSRGWTLQPDLQYVVHPGGRIANPMTPGSTAPIGNALVAGLRVTIHF
jgi:porin